MLLMLACERGREGWDISVLLNELNGKTSHKTLFCLHARERWFHDSSLSDEVLAK
jgi:hypothetical protein